MKRRRTQLGEPTKKDFESMAKILCRHGASEALTRDIANHFGVQNPRFQSERFVAATKRC